MNSNTTRTRFALRWTAASAVLMAFGTTGCGESSNSSKTASKQPSANEQEIENGNSKKSDEGPTTTGKQKPDIKDTMLRVQVYDDTKKKPLDANAEIWFSGNGSWFFKNEAATGGAAKNIGRRKVGEKQTGKNAIALYPDGRDGKEILIPFMMTTAMNPDGSPRDAVIINIGDDQIEVIGRPIEAATGTPEMKIQRHQ